MKRTLILSVLTLVGLGLASSNAFAFFWNKFHNKYQSVIICRPYNAFTPLCYGNMVCDGCCPSNPCHGPSMLPNVFPSTYHGMPMPAHMATAPWNQLPQYYSFAYPMMPSCPPQCHDPCGPSYTVASAPMHHGPMHQGPNGGLPAQTPPPPMNTPPGFTPPTPTPVPNMNQTRQQGTTNPLPYPAYAGYNYLPWNPNVYPVTYQHYQQQGWPTPQYWYGYGR